MKKKDNWLPLSDAVELVRDFSDRMPPAWHQDYGLKYISIRVDTRDGRCVLQDRNGNIIDPVKIKIAISKWHSR